MESFFPNKFTIVYRSMQNYFIIGIWNHFIGIIFLDTGQSLMSTK